MHQLIRGKRLTMGLAVLGLALNLLPGVAGAGEREQTLILGEVSDKPSETVKQLKPLVDYVAAKMADVGIVKGDVFMAKDKEAMVQALKEGKVDWVTDTAYPAMLFKEQAGAEILVRRWKKGVGAYHSVFFTHKDSPIQSLADLKGQVVAFQEPSSTTAFFVPLAELKAAGLTVDKLASARDKPAGDHVGYAFANDEANVVAWTQRKMTAAGAFSNINFDKDVPDALKGDVRVFHQSKPLPRALELTRQGLDPKVKEKLKQVLLAAGDDATAKDALTAYGKTSKFDAFEGEAKTGLDEAHKMMETIRDQLK